MGPQAFSGLTQCAILLCNAKRAHEFQAVYDTIPSIVCWDHDWETGLVPRAFGGATILTTSNIPGFIISCKNAQKKCHIDLGPLSV